ncbi:hypothetical protein DFJ74DRAFT_708053 [Hyaloraphidium curvatum]|nr:hypothetical protein DFJ74DRAFT_708053 [Hyaloraphidium curvatum]
MDRGAPAPGASPPGAAPPAGGNRASAPPAPRPRHRTPSPPSAAADASAVRRSRSGSLPPPADAERPPPRFDSLGRPGRAPEKPAAPDSSAAHAGPISGSGTNAAEKRAVRRRTDAPAGRTSADLAPAPPRTVSAMLSGPQASAAARQQAGNATLPRDFKLSHPPPASLPPSSSGITSSVVAARVAADASPAPDPPAPAPLTVSSFRISPPAVSAPTVAAPTVSAPTIVVASGAAGKRYRAAVPTKLRNVTSGEGKVADGLMEEVMGALAAGAVVAKAAEAARPAGVPEAASAAPKEAAVASAAVPVALPTPAASAFAPAAPPASASAFDAAMETSDISPSSPSSTVGSGTPRQIRPPAPLPSRPSTPAAVLPAPTIVPATPSSLASSATLTQATLRRSKTPVEAPTYPLAPMSARTRRRKACWSFTHWLKASLALLIASGLIAGISYRIATMASETAVANAGYTSSTNCSLPPAGYPPKGALLEPSSGGPLFGFQMDWAIDTPQLLAARIGRRPAIYGCWVHIDSRGYDAEMLDWYPKVLLAQAKEEGGDPSLLMVTVLPNVTMDNIPEGTLSALADQLARINRLGVGCIVRFAHEMNGPWHPYGQLPVAYVRTFRELHRLVHARTNMTATMWAPNAGNCGYPWVGGRDDNWYPVPAGDREKLALDTNGDGRIDGDDDPYTPYYPGDAHVDWIGLSVYHYSIPAPERAPKGTEGNNSVPRPGLARALITGEDLCDPGVPVWSVSAIAEKAGKPLAVPETGAVYYPTSDFTVGGREEMEVKRGWWRQVLELGRPVEEGGVGAKMVLWFEEDKIEPDRGNVSYAVTHKPSVRREFLRELNAETMVWGDAIRPWCDGSLGDGAEWTAQ